jgi:hypothetical protein
MNGIGPLALLLPSAEEVIMDEFDRSRNCPKCDSTKPSENVYHPESMEFEHGCADGEHMHRKCVDCYYQWSEAPLDAS